MCGITGWVSFDRDLSRERNIARQPHSLDCEPGPRLD
jgi:hypothetical protein